MAKFSNSEFTNLEFTNLKYSNIYEDSDMEDLTNGLQRFNITDYDITINSEKDIIIFMRKNDAQSSIIFFGIV
jgi:hypothetical protein